MYHVFDAWSVKVVINYEQNLQTTPAFVDKLGALVSL